MTCSDELARSRVESGDYTAPSHTVALALSSMSADELEQRAVCNLHNDRLIVHKLRRISPRLVLRR